MWMGGAKGIFYRLGDCVGLDSKARVLLHAVLLFAVTHLI